MNYRHAYHAGNFADVLKHAVLARVIDYLKRKPAPFRVIDTHAGAGRYALTSLEAAKTGEWQDGIARLLGPEAKPLPPAVADLLQPYLDAVRAENPGLGLRQGLRPGLSMYPGSPCLALHLMRPHDVLIANELHPEELAQLKAAIGKDRRAKAMALDAGVAIKALLPPKERRGVMLIDPPFEEAGELARMVESLQQAMQRFATGVYIAWYPIKDTKPIDRFHAELAALALPSVLRVELLIQPPRHADRLNGCGLIVANPPFALERELATILPELSRRLAAPGGGGQHRLDWIAKAPAGGPRGAPATKRRVRSSR
jgi:23S rRNA (adenine2030-N6)-methyltransferase